MFVLAAASLIVLGIGADIAADTGIDADRVGLLVTAFALPYAVFAPLGQWWLGNRCSPRAVVITGGVVLAAGLCISGLSAGPVMLLLSRAVSAVGAALITPAALTIAISLVTPGERGRAIAAVYLGFTLASVIGIPLGTLLAQALGWRWTFYGLGGVTLVLTLLALAILPATAATGAVSLRAMGGLLTNSKLLCVLGAALAQLAAQFLLLAPMAVILVDHFNLPASRLPVVLFVFGVAGVIGNDLGGRCSDRFALANTLIASLAGLAVVLLALSLPLGGFLAAVAFALLAFFGTVFRPPQIVLLTNLVNEDLRSTVVGLNTTANYVGLTIGSAVSAAVIPWLGYSALGCVALIFLAAAAALVWFATRQPPSVQSPGS